MDDAAEHGAYLLLLMAMWSRGGSLPNNSELIRKTAKVKPQRWPAIWEAIGPFFELNEDGELTQRRIVKELDYVRETSHARSEAGARGGRAKSLKNKKPPVAIAKQLCGKDVAPSPEIEDVLTEQSSISSASLAASEPGARGGQAEGQKIGGKEADPAVRQAAIATLPPSLRRRSR